MASSKPVFYKPTPGLTAGPMFPTQGLNQRHSADTSNSADYPINYKPSKASLNYIAKLNYRKQRVLAVISRRATAFSRDYIQTQDDIPVIVDRNKTVVRSAGGEIWNDSRLLEWDKNGHRIFVGDLGKDVNDDMLRSAFSKYSSFQKARVIREKKTAKSKGYGFVSFGDASDYVKALKEMNGKYIGSRPCKLSKSTSDERNVDVAAIMAKK